MSGREKGSRGKEGYEDTHKGREIERETEIEAKLGS